MDYSIHATWVLPSTGAPIRDGVIRVANNRIASIETYSKIRHSNSGSNMLELDGEAILPGLINAHTHLEFSDLQKPLGHRGIEFTEWLELVIANRISRTTDSNTSISSGIEESLKFGTVALGEIATTGWIQDDDKIDSNISGVCFLERLGNAPSRHTELIAGSNSFVSKPAVNENWHPGISPHSPYSVSLPLLGDLIEVAKKEQSPVAMHLAETEAELELLQSGTGPFVEFLERVGAWFPERFETSVSVLNYLSVLNNCSTCLVVHGNYLNERELDFIASNKQFSIVYCPRTHDYFAHQPYPLELMLDRGINLAIGTDSRASNPDLSVWSELNLVANKFPGIDRQAILQMGTINGSRALQLDRDFGDLQTGMRAKLLRIKLANPNTLDPFAEILESTNYPTLVDVASLSDE